MQINSADEPYQMDFHIVHSSGIRQRGKFKLGHVKRYTGRRACNYVLCEQCKDYLVVRYDDAKNVWPLFLYCLLFDFHTSVFGGSYHHYFVHRCNTLWQLIPRSIREW